MAMKDVAEKATIPCHQFQVLPWQGIGTWFESFEGKRCFPALHQTKMQLCWVGLHHAHAFLRFAKAPLPKG